MRASLKLISEVRDLQIVDKDQRNCGICDDVELDGAPGGDLTVKALLVGPAGMRGRLPRWIGTLLSRVCSAEVTHIPWRDIESISGRIILKTSANEYRLNILDHKLAPLLSKIPAL